MSSITVDCFNILLGMELNGVLKIVPSPLAVVQPGKSISIINKG
jgi:hypothetical protein